MPHCLHSVAVSSEHNGWFTTRDFDFATMGGFAICERVICT